MQHSEDQKAQIKLLYAKRRRNQLTMTVPLVAIIFAVLMKRGCGNARGSVGVQL